MKLGSAFVAALTLVLLAARRRVGGEQPASLPPYKAIIVMGPSGCGKSTLSQALAAHIQSTFIEGDDHHSPANIAQMAAGVPLAEEDRTPFLDSIGRAIASSRRLTVVSCSALRRAHRDRLRSYTKDILFVWIDVPAQELERRLRQRQDHFMPVSLLADQLATFEPPAPSEHFIRIDGALATADQLRAILLHLDRRGIRGQAA